jgi:hypothetical protein
LALAVAAPALGANAKGGIEKLTDTIPASTNVIVAIDVKGMQQSAFAQQWGWTAEGGSKTGFANPLARVKGVDQLVAAARMNFSNMDSTWETAVLQRSDPKQALPGAAVDKLADRPTNRGVSGLLLVDLGDGTVAAVHDGDRQLAAQWIAQRTSGKTGDKASDYLRQAAAKTAGGTPIVLAFDLKDAISTPEAMDAFLTDPPEALAGISEGDAAELGKLFASLRGVTLAISADREPRGEATIQFGADASKLGDKAKPVLLELLGRQGLGVSDFNKWDFKVSGDRVVATGPFSTGGVKRVLKAVRAPNYIAPAGDKDAKDPAKLTSADPKIAASQRYFAAVSQTIDELRPAGELGQTASWLVKDAKQIDALPILNVDPELVAWGGQVSMALRDLASIQASGQRQVRAQTNLQTGPNTYAYYDGDETDSRANAEARANWNNYQRQRRAAADGVKVGITEQSSAVAKDLLKSRNDIRTAMTQKYSAEF